MILICFLSLWLQLMHEIIIIIHYLLNYTCDKQEFHGRWYAVAVITTTAMEYLISNYIFVKNEIL